jgi:hypothetical protein
MADNIASEFEKFGQAGGEIVTGTAWARKMFLTGR